MNLKHDKIYKQNNIKACQNKTTEMNMKKIFKRARDKRHITNREAKMRITTDLSSKTIQAKRLRNNIFNVLKEEYINLVFQNQ